LQNLTLLSDVLEDPDAAPHEFKAFADASTSKTNVAKERITRFQWYCRVSLSPNVGQKTGLNKIVSGAVFKRGAAAPLIDLPAVARKAVKGAANCFVVRGVQRSEAWRAQTLDGLRSVGYSVHNKLLALFH